MADLLHFFIIPAKNTHRQQEILLAGAGESSERIVTNDVMSKLQKKRSHNAY